MLFVHEVHTVAGPRADEFAACFRDGWAPTLAAGSEARLLWYLDQVHGTGPAYTVVTITALASASVWDDVADRIRRGDLRSWAAEVDALRHDSQAKVLEPLPWSPLQELDLATVPTTAEGAVDHVLFMEDTAWPYEGRFDDYVERAGTLYVETLRRAAEHGRNLLDLVAAFTPRFGTGRHREVVLWQRVSQPQLLLPLLTREVPPEHRAPGTWMHDALEVRDRWESRLLRVAEWSPLA